MGARRTENILPSLTSPLNSSDDMTGANSAGATASYIGEYSEVTITVSGGSSYIRPHKTVTQSIFTIGDTISLQCKVRGVGSSIGKSVRVSTSAVSDTQAGGSFVVLSSEWQTIEFNRPAKTNSNVEYMSLFLGLADASFAAGDVVHVKNWQLENTTKQSIKVTSEYIPTTTTAVTKWFDTAPDGNLLRPIGWQDGRMLYDTYAPWEAAEAVTVGKRKKIDVNGKGMWIECSTQGTTGATEPDWYNEVQPELVTNGTFDTDTSGWATFTSIRWDAGGLVVDFANYNGEAHQILSTEIGKTYTVTYTVVSDTQSGGGESRVGVWESYSDATLVQTHYYTRNVAGTYSFTFTATNTTPQIRIQKGGNTGETKFDNISIRLAEPNGTITDNTASWDITPTNYYTYKGALIEEARTNLLTYSSEFDNVIWTKTNVTVTADATTAPDGTLTADKIVADTFSGAHFLYQPVTVTVGDVGVMALWCKKSEYNFVQLFSGAGMSTLTWVNFDLANGTVGNSGADASGSIYGGQNGWYLCVATYTKTSATTTAYFEACPLATDSTSRATTYTGDGTSGIYIWGAQYEIASAASSYIPTTTAAVTRNADVLSYPTANWYADGQAGTFAATYSIKADGYDNEGNKRILGGSTGDAIISFDGSPTLAGIGTYDGSTALNFSPTTVVDEGNIYTSFDGAYRSLAYNGTYTTDAMSSSFLAGGARMVVGGTNVSSLNLNGCLLNIIYYQKRLANSVIEANSSREYSND